MATRSWSRREFLNATASCGVVFISGGASAAPDWLASLVEQGRTSGETGSTVREQTRGIAESHRLVNTYESVVYGNAPVDRSDAEAFAGDVFRLAARNQELSA